MFRRYSRSDAPNPIIHGASAAPPKRKFSASAAMPSHSHKGTLRREACRDLLPIARISSGAPGRFASTLSIRQRHMTRTPVGRRLSHDHPHGKLDGWLIETRTCSVADHRGWHSARSIGGPCGTDDVLMQRADRGADQPAKFAQTHHTRPR